MAEFLDKDPYSYDKERQAFVNELRQFHMRIGTPLLRLPSIAGKELDLYLLYKKVIALGGLAKIVYDDQWEDILAAFKFPPSCCHAAFALRSFYVKYLEAYEKIHHQGEDAAEVMAAHRPSVPTGQMQGNSRIPDKLRSSVGLSTAKSKVTDYDKIINSLQCGLPNEVDFAINVCTLLSNEGKHVIHLERAPHLIDLLLAHVGVFFEGPGSMRVLYEEDWVPTTNRNFVKYWYDTVEDKEVREVIGPEPFKPKGNMSFKDGELLCSRTQGLNDVEEQRITQISIILRNLSFEKHNKRVMAAHRTLYRFLLLCVHNSDSALKQLGIDTLSNLAADFVLDPIDYRSTQLMFHTIDKGMKDPDRLVVLRAMEVLQKLSKVRANLETIKMCLESRVYQAIIQMLIVHDVQLLLGALEVLLALSQTGEIICTRIAKVDKSIDILVCLVTLDAQSLGAEAFIGIKIVDHAPHGIHHPVVTMARYQGRNTPNTPPPSQGTSLARSGSSRRQDGVATPPPQQQNSSAAPMSRAAESESFASQWLNSRYESNPQGSVSRIDLYADYLSACSKMTRGSILNSNSFAACIRNGFPNVGFQRIQLENGAQYHITGIQRRATALPLRWKNTNPNQQGPPQVNYQMQVGTNQNTASNIIAHLARKHSPGKSTPSPPPPRVTSYPLQPVVNSSSVSPLPSPQVQATPVQVQVQGGTTQQYSQKPNSSMISNQAPATPTGRPPPPGPSQNPGTALQYPAGYILPTQPNQLPQTVLQRPPPSHIQAMQASPAASPNSLQSRSVSSNPSGAVSNPVTSPQPPSSVVVQPDSNPSPAPPPANSTEKPPRNDITNGSMSNSPATVIIGGLVSTEKCSPPSKAPLPEGEVRIEKVPNLHAQLLQQAQKKAQQQGTHPAVPLPLQVQQQQGFEVPVAAPSPDGGLALNALPNPVGLQQQMQQAMQAATAMSTQSLTVPNSGQQPITTTAPISSPQANHSTAPGTTQYVPIQPKPNMPVPSAISPQQQLPSPHPNPHVQQAVQVGMPQQNQMQVVLINRPPQPGSVQPQQAVASVPQQQSGQYGQVRAYTQQATLPNQFPRLAAHISHHNTSSSNTDSPLIKRLLQSGTPVQPPVRVSPPTRVSPPQQQMVQPNPAVPVPNNSQWAGPNQTMPQVLPTQGFNHAVPVQTTQQPQIQPQNVGYMNNTTNMVPQANAAMPNLHVQNAVMHRPSPPPPPPTVNEQLQQHRENQRQLQQIQQQHAAIQNVPTQSPQPSANLNNGKPEDLGDGSKKTNGPTSTPALIPQDSTNGSNTDELMEESTKEVPTKEVPKCNGTSQDYESISKSMEEKMEVDPIVKPPAKPVESLLKQRLVNGYGSDSELPIRNDVVTVNRVEEVEKTSGILEAALSIAGIEPDSDSRTSSGNSTPNEQLVSSGKGNALFNHVLNGEILCDRNKSIVPPVGDSNLNQGNKTGIAMIIGNNGTAQDSNIPRPNAMNTKPVNQLILCRDIRENLPPSLHILPSNFNNNNPQQQPQQAGTAVVTAAAAAPQVSTSNSSGSVQLVAQPVAAPQQQQVVQQQQQQQQQQVQIQNTAVSRNNTVQVQGAIITVQQPQTQMPVQMSTTQVQQVQQAQPVTYQLQQQQAVSVQQPTGVRQLVVTTQHPQQQQQQLSYNMQQQTLIVRPVQPGTTQPQTMNIQVQNPNGQTQQQVIRVPVSIQGGQQQILSVQRPLQAGQQQTQQSMFIVNVNTNQNASHMPAPTSVTTIKSSGNLKRPAPADSPKSKVNNTVEGTSLSSSSSSSHHKEKKKKHHSSSKKKRKSSSSSSNSSSSHHQCSKKQSSQAEQPKTPAIVCMCEWKGCRRSFSTPKSLHIHASKMHVMSASYRMMCEWEGCDHIQRQRWSCVSHILDKHCSQQAVKAASDRRAKQAAPGNVVVSGPTQPPIVYNAHNAYHAIRRSLHNPSLKDLLGETEGPVTKSIRLTASLVLKNLATRSSEARRLIRKHESHLARLAISQAEASTTLSKCILELNKNT